MRIGIDVGGTNTDAVLMNGNSVLATTKALTTDNVTDGVIQALETILTNGNVAVADIRAVMLGTTQFTNAVIERRELSEIAAIRIGLPSGEDIPPITDWPADIAQKLGNNIYMVGGGYLYDGTPLAPLDEEKVDDIIADIKLKKLETITISSVFSPMNSTPEILVANKILEAIPTAQISLSHEMGRIGLLERENAALLNAALLNFADRVVSAFQDAVRKLGLICPSFISQNDGTLMDMEFARKYPALTFASGPTNSLRGAAQLTGLENAIVVDIGGTTTDIGILQDGFPRESNNIIEVGGVRTNFRMPDIMTVGIGGGSLVSEQGQSIGPKSVGHRLVTEGLVFGGKTLTATDIIVAAGLATVGDSSNVSHIDAATIENAQYTISSALDQAIEKMKPSADPGPVILVGGGSILVTKPISAASEVLRPEYAAVANAIGAAIAQIGGEVEKLISYKEMPRKEAKSLLIEQATKKAVDAGADPDTIRVLDIEETAIGYMDEGRMRLKIKVVGDISGLSQEI